MYLGRQKTEERVVASIRCMYGCYPLRCNGLSPIAFLRYDTLSIDTAIRLLTRHLTTLFAGVVSMDI